MRSRKEKGAVLALVAILMAILAALGSAFYYLTKMITGNKQMISATDSGALNAARALLAISVPANNIATEFQGLGVNVPADPSNPGLAPGAPDPINGKYNIFAYNRAAGAATLIAANALQILNDNPKATQARDNATRVIDNLQQFGKQLNAALTIASQPGNPISLAFINMASVNDAKLNTKDNSTNIVGNMQLASIPTSSDGTTSKSNIYFNSNLLSGPDFYNHLLSATQDSSGLIKSTAQPDTNAKTYEQTPYYQSGQPFLKAYTPLHFDFGNGISRDIYLSACSPASPPHLIDQDRIDPKNNTNQNYAPFNALTGQIEIEELDKNKQITSTTATAAAVVGSIYNQYPATLAHGYIRIHNAGDARTTNSSLSTVYAAVDGSPIIFNNELFEGIGGGEGIVQSDNGVFGTIASGTAAELEYWAAYNNSTGRDPLGHYDHIDPTHGLQFGIKYLNVRVPSIYWPYPKENVRFGSESGQLATLEQMRNIHAVYPVCSASMYGDPNISSVCLDNFDTWNSNYNDGPGSATYLPQEVTITNLEALKGEVITQWLNHWYATQEGTTNTTFRYTFTTDGSEFANDSGSKAYQRYNVGYATPTNSPTIAFGTVATPGQLLDQLATNGSTCLNLNNTDQWNDPNSIQARLLQRCRQILPNADAGMLKTLLNQMPLDLGQYQYIYLPPGANTLAISQTPPAILKDLPEFTQPGITAPDGTALPLCKSSDFYGAVGNQVNAQIGAAGQNILGDNALHDEPFLIFNGTVNTYDYVTWTPSTGANNLLGELTFFNHVSTNGTFSAPN